MTLLAEPNVEPAERRQLEQLVAALGSKVA
jgi:hypothetical protein